MYVVDMLLIFVQMFAHPLSGNIAGQVFGANDNRKDAFITSSPNEQTSMRTVWWESCIFQ